MEVTDKILYEKIKKKVYADIPKHSAYRSGILVQKYKEAFKNKYKNTRKKPYKGNRTKKKGLRRWFDEEWVNQRGEVGYKYKNDVYRPKIRITDDTPITHDELTKKEIEKARVKKYRKGRIDRFRKEKKSGGDRWVPQQYDDSDDEKYIYNNNEIGFGNENESESESEGESESDDDLNRAFFINENVLSEEEEFNLFKEFYLEKVNICFNKYKLEVMNSNYTELLEEQTNLELILEHIQKSNEVDPLFCDDLPDYKFNFNEELINYLDTDQKEELFNDVSQNLKQNILKIEIDTDVFIRYEFNDLERKIINEDLENIEKTDNFIRIICFILIKQIIENIIYNFLFPDRNNIFSDIDDAYEWDDSFDPDEESMEYMGGKWSKKYKKSIDCKNPKGFSQKQHCKYGKNKTQKIKIKFKDYPDFRPNLTPREMFVLGSFGGTYWRPIDSGVTGKSHKNKHLKYPKSWWKGIPEEHLTSDTCDVSINKYKVNVGTSLEFWESKNWINKLHPYGWVQWYCDFYQGKRCPDDERQIQRWKNLAGPKGRFMRFLVTQIIKKGAKWNDETISPKIRQVLQHWGYKLTNTDYNNEIKRRSA